MTVEVIVPWRPGCPHRAAAWASLLPRWAQTGWPVTVAEPPAGEWIKAAAVNPAVERSGAHVIVVADADVWCDGTAEAVQLVAAGRYPWAVPHAWVHRLNEHATADVIAGGPWPAGAAALAERPYVGHAGGGIVVALREAVLSAPLDPRFVGWGHEDDSWSDALTTLAGAAWRGTRPLWHLWHPPQPRRNRRHGSPASRTLRLRYQNAAGDPAAMKALVEEGRHAWRTSASN